MKSHPQYCIHESSGLPSLMILVISGYVSIMSKKSCISNLTYSEKLLLVDTAMWWTTSRLMPFMLKSQTESKSVT